MLLPFALAASASLAAAQQPRELRYTSNADFGGGVALNLVAVGDQLEFASQPKPFPFVNVACSGRGTLVRIDIETGAVLGEYFTAPDGMGRDPSRATVDRLGNVWVANRAEAGTSRGEPRGSLARIGLVIGGTRGTKDEFGVFTPDPQGDYLRPPFRYSTCRDRDGDGLIRTSRGFGHVLAWSNLDNADANGGVATAEDECVIDYTRVSGTNARTVAVDAHNDVWVGGLGNQAHEQLDGRTGLPIAGTQFNVSAGGYGGLVDGYGVLWSARGGGGLLRHDPASATSLVLGNSCGDYGLGVDPATGNIWHTGLSTGTVCVRDPAGTCLGCFSHGSGNAQGVVVDARANVWVAHALLGPSTSIGHLRTDGTFVGNVPLNHPSGNGSGPTGVAIDSSGKVWVTCYYSNNVLRVDPNAGVSGGGGFAVGAVDLVVDLGAGATPYNYSDMTGFVGLAATANTGTWTRIEDSGELGHAWGALTWNGREPPGTSVVVEARACDSPARLPELPFTRAKQGESPRSSAARGRYVEIRATLSRQIGVSASPALLDCGMIGGASAAVTLTCPPDFAELRSDAPLAEQLDPARTGAATFRDTCARGARLVHADSSVRGASPGAPEVIVTRRWTLTDDCDAEEACEQTITLFSAEGRDGALTLDASPGLCPNEVDVLGDGSTSFALVGTWLHETASVDSTSLRLRRADGVGREIALARLPLVREDVARPFFGPAGACHALGGEGHVDAVTRIPNWMLRRAFDLDTIAAGALVELELTGRLADGAPFEARDFIRVR